MASKPQAEQQPFNEAPIELIKAIAHPLRYQILACIALGEHNVGEIEGVTGIGQPTLSQQLSVLRNAGLVTARRDAKLVFYTIEPEALGQVCTAFQLICPVEFQGKLKAKLIGASEPLVEPGQPQVADDAPSAPLRRRGGAAVFAKLG